MGLTDFNSDSDDESDTTESEASTTDSTEPEKEEASGLDAFKTESSSSETNEKDRDDAMPWRHDFTAGEWNNMTAEEKTEYVRHNYYPEYRPDVTIDDRFSWNNVTELHCVCDEEFTIRAKGTCQSCGRTYERHGKVVILTDEPVNNT